MAILITYTMRTALNMIACRSINDLAANRNMIGNRDSCNIGDTTEKCSDSKTHKTKSKHCSSEVEVDISIVGQSESMSASSTSYGTVRGIRTKLRDRGNDNRCQPGRVREKVSRGETS